MPKAAACVTTNSVITVSDLNTTVNCEPRVHDLRLAEALGFAKHYDIRSLVRRHLSTLATFGEVCSTRNKPSARGGRPGTEFYLNKRQALFITAKSDTERAALVTVQMVEVFDAVTNGGLPETVKVREHRRRLPAPRPRETFEDGCGVVAIGGTLFRFDANVRPGPGARAVVVKEDRTLAVVDLLVDSMDYACGTFPARVMVDRAGPFQRGILRMRDAATLVGLVVRVSGSAAP